jgi:hypothetical protein
VAAGAQAQGGAASAGSGTAWAGPPGTRGLDLLDASIGALVHGSEDEASAVSAQQQGWTLNRLVLTQGSSNAGSATARMVHDLMPSAHCPCVITTILA